VGSFGQVTRRVCGTGRAYGGIHGQLDLTDVVDNRPVARVLQLIGLAEIRSHDFDRRSEPNLSVCKYVDAQAAAVNESPQQSRSAEAVEVPARLALAKWLTAPSRAPPRIGSSLHYWEVSACPPMDCVVPIRQLSRSCAAYRLA